VFNLLLSTGLAACASVLHGGSSDVCGSGNLANRLKLASIDEVDRTRCLIHDSEQREEQLVERQAGLLEGGDEKRVYACGRQGGVAGKIVPDVT
jgi:hypothetical protein